MWVSWEHRLAPLLLVLLLGLSLCLGCGEDSGSCPFSSREPHHHHHCDPGHHVHEHLHRHHGHHQHYHHEHHMGLSKNKLPEEMAEEEDLKLYGIDQHDHRDSQLSNLAGIVLFLLVEKVVRYVEACSGNEGKRWGHGHQHHHHKSSKKLDEHIADGSQLLHSIDGKYGNVRDKLFIVEVLDGVSGNCSNEKKHAQHEFLLCKENKRKSL